MNKLKNMDYRPLRYLYYLKKSIPLEDITVQKEEVESVSYMSTSKINELIDNNQMLESHAIMFNTLIGKRNNIS